MITYRASSLGRCLRASVLERQGHIPLPPPRWLQEIYDGGHIHEVQCQNAMLADGWWLSPGQEEVNLQIADDIIVQGHLDGLCERLDGSVKPSVWEAKSPSAWAKFERAYKTDDWADPLAARYAWQLSVYMVATGLEAVVACLDGETIKTFGIEIPPRSRGDIENRVRLIEEWARTDVLRPPLTCDANDGAGCPFRSIPGGFCSAVEIEFDPILDQLVAEYDDAKHERDLLDEVTKRYREKIIAHLGDASRTTDEWKVTQYSTKRTTLDKVAVTEAGIDLAPFEKVSESTGLRVTRRGMDEDNEFGT